MQHTEASTVHCDYSRTTENKLTMIVTVMALTKMLSKAYENVDRS